MTIPQQIGHYLVDREIGRGGMGVVYLARDPRLDRDVAIKSLPAEWANDPERLARFEREARSLAQLNHPNIAGIYGVEEQDGQRFLILEYVEGDTLADRLERGPLAADEARELAVEIAAGVEAAHEAGVIHRDLKPDNIKIAPDGRVKVLDFGIAKAAATTTTGAPADASTLTGTPTNPGVILGTAAYMSPEQARGRLVDKRTDIWSFGVILYEMLTGANPFAGRTFSDSIGAVMHKDVRLEALPPRSSPATRHVLRRCIERDLGRRYRDIGDVRIELESGRDDDSLRSSTVATRRSPATVTALVAFGLVVGGALAVAGLRVVGPADVGPGAVKNVERYEILIDRDATARRSAFDPLVTIAPDGSGIAYEAFGRLWVRPIDSFDPIEIDRSEGGVAPFWSPDSRWIGFARGLELWRSTANGMRAQRIGAIPEVMNNVNNFTWRSDGQILFTTNEGSISRIPATGGDWVEVVAPPPDVNDFHSIETLPGDEALLVTVHFSTDARRHRLGIWDGSDLRVINELGSPGAHVDNGVYSTTGHILFEQSGDNAGVWAAPFSASTLEVTGPAFLVAPGAGSPSVDARGTLIYARGGGNATLTLVWADPGTGATTPLHEDASEWLAFPSISRDGAHVAYVSPLATRRGIWVEHLETGAARRVNAGHAVNLWPHWSPDGATIAAIEHNASRPDEPRMVFYAADGSGPVREPIADVDNPGFDEAWSTVVFQRGQPKTDLDIFSVRLDGTGEPVPVIADPSAQYDPRLSPDGRWLAYTSEESSGPQVILTRFPSAEGRWEVSDGFGERPQWSADGTKLYFIVTNARLSVVDFDGEDAVRLGRPREVIESPARAALNPYRGYAFDPKGDRILVPRRPTGGEFPSIAVVRNWVAEFTDP
ncbi:MAG: protein kinase domain-containing protein [Planctomycetota bacterium]